MCMHIIKLPLGWQKIQLSCICIAVRLPQHHHFFCGKNLFAKNTFNELFLRVRDKFVAKKTNKWRKFAVVMQFVDGYPHSTKGLKKKIYYKWGILHTCEFRGSDEHLHPSINIANEYSACLPYLYLNKLFHDVVVAHITA